MVFYCTRLGPITSLDGRHEVKIINQERDRCRHGESEWGSDHDDETVWINKEISEITSFDYRVELHFYRFA